jgi:hypothetical protein
VPEVYRTKRRQAFLGDDVHLHTYAVRIPYTDDYGLGAIAPTHDIEDGKASE